MVCARTALTCGAASKRRDDRISDLVLDDVGRLARPGGMNDDFDVGNVRQRVERNLTQAQMPASTSRSVPVKTRKRLRAHQSIHREIMLHPSRRVDAELLAGDGLAVLLAR